MPFLACGHAKSGSGLDLALEPELLSPDAEGKDTEERVNGPRLQVAAINVAHTPSAGTSHKVALTSGRAGSEVRASFVPTKKW